jgi:hypothetical protein
MLRVVAIALLTLTAAACLHSEAPQKATLITSYVTVEGAARMLAAEGVAAKWKAARILCNEAGHETGTNDFLECFKAYQAHSLQTARTRARALTETVARQYGLCIDRVRFEIARCQEI